MAAVLIVDDDPDILELIDLAFTNAGHRVSTAESAPLARTLIERQRPDLLVLDHMMPGMTGTELAETLRADPILASIPIILLTAVGELHRDLSVVDRWLPKPFSPRKLLGHAETLLRRARHAAESSR